ncbi:Beta-cyclopiazonate dehydrogenase [Cladobotryum mycophilum]|uniref:Beta-cyclopiazonate dehydrogenase n=1 Tax=Cladobotryum mycophilum TaxID=491253 RepID=A0ABR0SQ99_9HYPO
MSSSIRYRCLGSALWLVVTMVTALAAADFEDQDYITREVCIVGGGSTGTYAAVQLQDQGHSVVVVEQKSRLGGHAETEYYPDGFINYGVAGVFGNQLTKNYLERLGTGKKVAPNPNNLGFGEAAALYLNAIKQYNFTSEGTYDLPQPVPEELLRPFGEFVQKNRLEGALPLIFTFASGVGNILETPLLYVLQNFGIAHINALLSGYITPKEGLADIYKKAAAAIGPSNILYQTLVVEARRSEDGGINLVVQSADGCQKMIKAKKLLITMPPTMKNMGPFDLDAKEKSLFRKWHWQNYYAAIVNDSGIPNDLQVSNLDPSQPNSLPVPPFQWSLEYMGVPGYLASKIIAGPDFTADEAKDLVVSDIRRMKGTYPIQDPEIVAFADHTPTSMKVSAEDVRNGFYTRLYALQGQKSTYYTGLSFCSDYSSLLWAYTEKIIAQMF